MLDNSESDLVSITYCCCNQCDHSNQDFLWHNPIVALMGWELITKAVGKWHGSSCEKYIANHIDNMDIAIWLCAHWEEVVWVALRGWQTLVKFYCKAFIYICCLRKHVVIFWELLFGQLLDAQIQWNGHELSLYNCLAAVLDVPVEKGNVCARLNRTSTVMHGLRILL